LAEWKSDKQGLPVSIIPPGGKPDLKSVLRLYLFVFASLLLLGSYLQALHFEYGMIATQVLIILIPALMYWRRFAVDQVTFARLRPLPLKFVPAIVILAAAMWLVNVFIAAGLVGGLMELGFKPLVMIEPPTTWQQYLGYIVVLSVFAGICEEVLFRGTIMPALEQYGLVPAIIFSSLLFALLHGSLLSLLSTFSLGVIMAVIVIKTGSLWGGIIYHMLNNFYAATYLFWAGSMDAAPARFGLQTYLALLPFLVVGLIGVVIGLRMLHKNSDHPSLLGSRKAWLPSGWLSWPLYRSAWCFL
jgi:membrane protease YdiL (CAAX protease family)